LRHAEEPIGDGFGVTALAEPQATAFDLAAVARREALEGA